MTDKEIGKKQKDVTQHKKFQVWDNGDSNSQEDLGEGIVGEFDQFELNKKIGNTNIEDFNNNDYSTNFNEKDFTQKEIEEADNLA